MPHRDCHASLAMTVEKGLAMSPPLSLRGAAVPKQSHALRGNPKLEALNPEENQKSKIKNQNDKLKCKNLPFLPFDF